MKGTHSLDVLYQYVLEAIRSPDRFEFGDEVMDNVSPRSRAAFAGHLNGVAEVAGIPERVRSLKEIGPPAKAGKETQKQDFLLTLNRLFEKVRGEPEIARRIVPQKWIEAEQEALVDKYRAMSEDYYGIPQPLDINNEDSVVTWDKSHIEFLQTDDMLDQLVRFGSTVIKDMEDVWRALFLAQASTLAPAIVQGEKEHRAQLHILLIGEYSTSKSGFAWFLRRMFPRVVKCNDTTSAGLMGSINRKGERITGLAEEADRAILAFDEFDKLLKRNGNLEGVLRAILEDGEFHRKTAFGRIDYETKPSVFAMANPKRDVFFSNESLANQVPFKVGLLSRFDYVRPLAYSTAKINSIAKFIASTSFKRGKTENVMTTRDIMRTFYALQSSLHEKKVHQVGSEENLVMEIWERFTKLQKEIDEVPLLSVRDFMSALRVYNASAILHHMSREVREGVVMAGPQDMNNAIYLLDNTVKSREMLLTSHKRQDVCLTPVEKAYGHLLTAMQAEGQIPKERAVQILTVSMGIGQSTGYKFVNQIVARNQEIRQEGLREAILVLA